MPLWGSYLASKPFGDNLNYGVDCDIPKANIGNVCAIGIELFVGVLVPEQIKKRGNSNEPFPLFKVIILYEPFNIIYY